MNDTDQYLRSLERRGYEIRQTKRRGHRLILWGNHVVATAGHSTRSWASLRDLQAIVRRSADRATEIGTLAIRLPGLLRNETVTDYLSMRDQLLRAMRVDLGEEPGGPVTPG